MTLLDTGPLLASLDERDRDHQACRQLLLNSDEALIISAPVVVEVDYWIRKFMHSPVEDMFLADIESGAYQLVNVEAADMPRIRELCRTYYDSDLGYVDASILALAERLNVTKLATLDHRHFRMMRPRHVDALTLLSE